VLRLLLPPSFASDLRVAATERQIFSANRNANVCRWHDAFDPFAGNVVLEAGRSGFASSIVEHLAVIDWREGCHGIDGERLPGLQAESALRDRLELIGKNVGIGSSLEDFLRDLAGNLVLAV